MTDTITPTETDEAVLTELLILFVNSEPVSKSLALIARHAQQAREEENERCAKLATSFLVGDPAKGIPLRSPGPHAIAAAIRNTKGRDDDK